MAGNVFNNLNSPDKFMDDVLSVVLIIMFLCFMLYFVVGAANVLIKYILTTEWGKRQPYLDRFKPRGPREGTIEAEMEAYSIDRRKMVHVPKAGALKHRLSINETAGAGAADANKAGPSASVSVPIAVAMAGHNDFEPRFQNVMAGRESRAGEQPPPPSSAPPPNAESVEMQPVPTTAVVSDVGVGGVVTFEAAPVVEARPSQAE
jgi:hypothetical protein